MRSYLTISFLLSLLAVFTASAGPPYAMGRILAKPRAVGSPLPLGAKPKPQVRVLRAFEQLRQLQIIEVPAGRDPLEMARELNASGWYEFAEPDYYVHAAATVPNDPRFRDQYALLNVQSPAKDIDATLAWDLLHDATNVIVAVLDSGIRATHEDLKANLWKNPREVAGDGIDNDKNGVVDDVNGMSVSQGVVSGPGINDVFGHGTHVSGIIGAVGNNALGGAGVAWNARIMTCRFLVDPGGRGDMAGAVVCIDYARRMGARVINASWNGTNDSSALYNAILAAQEAGIVFVTAAGNEASNNDTTPVYPGNYPISSMITVAATTQSDTLWAGSNFGTNSVHIAAPGQAIYSTYLYSNSGYETFSGTSQATAYVSGAAALIMARFPYLNPAQVVDRILKSVDVIPVLKGKVKTGGRLNLAKALRTIPAFDLRIEITPRFPSTLHYTAFPLFSPVVLETTSDFSGWHPVWTNTFTTVPPWTSPLPVTADPHPYYRLRAP